jgi:DNA-binding GntR family transcriptional regulator
LTVEGLSFDPASQPRTREEFAADRLREAIFRGELEPGQRLDEHALAELWGVSRTPVRSAIRILAAESLIELHPHRGAVVNELSPDELEEIYLVRGMLEGMAARLAAPKMDEERVETLRSILVEMDATPDPDLWLALNNRFHHTIYQAANRPRLLSIIEYVRNIATPYIRQFIDAPDHMESSRMDHHRILDACASGDGVRAEAEIRKHLQEVCEANLEYVDSSATDS